MPPDRASSNSWESSSARAMAALAASGGRLHILKQGFTGIRCEDKVVLAYKAFCLGGQPVCLAGKYMHPHGMEFLGMYGIHRFTPNVMHSNVAGEAGGTAATGEHKGFFQFRIHTAGNRTGPLADPQGEIPVLVGPVIGTKLRIIPGAGAQDHRQRGDGKG